MTNTTSVHHFPFSHYGEDDPKSFESVIFRLSRSGLDFEKFHDPLTTDFVLIHSPFKFVSLLVAIVTFLKVTEKVMSRRTEGFHFARPAFLVNCGLTFGINGCGALIALAVTEGGNHLFQCIDRTDLTLATVFCRYLIFVYLSTLVYDLASLVLPILQKQTISNHVIVRQVVWIWMAFIIMKYQPIGFPVFVPVTHSLLKVLNNMLSVMKTASHELKPDDKWSKRLEVASILIHVLMLVHQVYFATLASCAPTWVSSAMSAFAAIQTISVLSAPTSKKNQLTDFILG